MNNSKEAKILRANLLGGMNSYIKELGDEEIWVEWIAFGVPDECDEDTLMEIANDEPEFVRITKVFHSLIRYDLNTNN
jgi:hypothetical protein